MILRKVLRATTLVVQTLQTIALAAKWWYLVEVHEEGTQSLTISALERVQRHLFSTTNIRHHQQKNEIAIHAMFALALTAELNGYVQEMTYHLLF